MFRKLLCIVIVFSGNVFWGQTSDHQKIADQGIVTPQEQEQEEQEFLVDKFFQSPGLFFLDYEDISLRNTLKNSFYYDSNIYLSTKSEEDSSVYSMDFQSKIDYHPGKLTMEIAGGVKYEYYFEDSDIQNYTPHGEILLFYEEDLWYVRVKNSIARYSTINQSEVNVRSAWHKNVLETSVGYKEDRYIAEISFDHKYVDFRKIRGDVLHFGPGFLVGYQISPRVYGVAEYGFSKIDYREAVIARGEKQDDSIGHAASLGVNIEIQQNIAGQIRMGIQYRDARYLWGNNGNITWYPASEIKITLDWFRGFATSLFGNYLISTFATLGVQYLVTESLAFDVKFTFVHNNPEKGDNFKVVYGKCGIIYRIEQRIDAEIFYKPSVWNSENEAGDYERHQVGGALSIIF